MFIITFLISGIYPADFNSHYYSDSSSGSSGQYHSHSSSGSSGQYLSDSGNGCSDHHLSDSISGSSGQYFSDSGNGSSGHYLSDSSSGSSGQCQRFWHEAMLHLTTKPRTSTTWVNPHYLCPHLLEQPPHHYKKQSGIYGQYPLGNTTYVNPKYHNYRPTSANGNSYIKNNFSVKTQNSTNLDCFSSDSQYVSHYDPNNYETHGHRENSEIGYLSHQQLLQMELEHARHDQFIMEQKQRYQYYEKLNKQKEAVTDKGQIFYMYDSQSDVSSEISETFASTANNHQLSAVPTVSLDMTQFMVNSKLGVNNEMYMQSNCFIDVNFINSVNTFNVSTHQINFSEQSDVLVQDAVLDHELCSEWEILHKTKSDGYDSKCLKFSAEHQNKTLTNVGACIVSSKLNPNAKEWTGVGYQLSQLNPEAKEWRPKNDLLTKHCEPKDCKESSQSLQTLQVTESIMEDGETVLISVEKEFDLNKDDCHVIENADMFTVSETDASSSLDFVESCKLRKVIALPANVRSSQQQQRQSKSPRATHQNHHVIAANSSGEFDSSVMTEVRNNKRIDATVSSDSKNSGISSVEIPSDTNAKSSCDGYITETKNQLACVARVPKFSNTSTSSTTSEFTDGVEFVDSSDSDDDNEAIFAFTDYDTVDHHAVRSTSISPTNNELRCLQSNKDLETSAEHDDFDDDSSLGSETEEECSDDDEDDTDDDDILFSNNCLGDESNDAKISVVTLSTKKVTPCVTRCRGAEVLIRGVAAAVCHIVPSLFLRPVDDASSDSESCDDGLQLDDDDDSDWEETAPSSPPCRWASAAAFGAIGILTPPASTINEQAKMLTYIEKERKNSLTQVEKANLKWDSEIDENIVCRKDGTASRGHNSVQFNDSVLVYSVEADIDRKGPWETFARDHMRFKHRIDNLHDTLSPALGALHRDKVFKGRFAESSSNEVDLVDQKIGIRSNSGMSHPQKSVTGQKGVCTTKNTSKTTACAVNCIVAVKSEICCSSDADNKDESTRVKRVTSTPSEGDDKSGSLSR